LQPMGLFFQTNIGQVAMTIGSLAEISEIPAAIHWTWPAS